MAQITVTVHWVNVGSITSMFDFHACILAEIDVISPCFVFLKVVLNPHVHIEGLIRLLLAVFNAFHLRLVFWSSKIEVHAVLVTFFEKQLWERVLPQRIFFIVGISTPVSGRCHFFN